MSHGTLSSNEFPGWYITFQGDVLSQLPRPGELSEDVADGWHTNRASMKKALREAFVPSPAAIPASQPLLIHVGTVSIAATTIPFVAKNRFVVNTASDAAVKISYLGDNFKNWFFGRTEVPFTGSTLKYGKLSRRSVDAPIIAELGGEEKATTIIIELFSLMEKQPNGESGTLLTNGCANNFCIRDVNKLLRSVYVNWYAGGWNVHAIPVSGPGGWLVESRFFSRDLVDAQ
jgi:hypothetical protein